MRKKRSKKLHATHVDTNHAATSPESFQSTRCLSASHQRCWRAQRLSVGRCRVDQRFISYFPIFCQAPRRAVSFTMDLTLDESKLNTSAALTSVACARCGECCASSSVRFLPKKSELHSTQCPPKITTPHP